MLFNCRRCGTAFSGGTCPSCDRLPYSQQRWKHESQKRQHQSQFAIGDLVRYAQAGGVWRIEEEIAPEVFRIGTGESFCDCVPSHMLEKLSQKELDDIMKLNQRSNRSS